MNVNNRSVFYFDLDESIWAIQTSWEENYPRLLQSAKSDLSSSQEGYIENTCLELEDSRRVFVPEMRAFARHDFKQVFEKIQKVNSNLKRKRVMVHVLTNGEYSKNQVVKLWDRFYGFTALDGFANRNREIESKGDQMLYDYNKIYKSQGISKENIYLIDNSQENCDSAQRHGFKSICMNNAQDSYNYEEDNYPDYKVSIFKVLNNAVESSVVRSKT